jgi:hypothetical protein
MPHEPGFVRSTICSEQSVLTPQGRAEVPQQFTVPERAIVRMEDTQMIVRADSVALRWRSERHRASVATWELSVTVLELAAQLPN